MMNALFDQGAYCIRNEYVKPTCDLNVSCQHLIGTVPSQLNLCAFIREAYHHQVGVDIDASYIVDGVMNGFRIVDKEFRNTYYCENYDSITTGAMGTQMNKLLDMELAEYKITEVSYPPTCVHSLGAVPKKDGSLRNITDCKRPIGLSINNFMDSTSENFTFITIDKISKHLTKNCFMSVLDIKSAYRSVNVFPEHTKFQGFSWRTKNQTKYFTDNCLSFGLKCSPFIFSMLTDFVIRSMRRRGFRNVFGYLDDYIIIGESLQECLFVRQVLIKLLRNLGFHLSYAKLLGPSKNITFLGINIDSTTMELSLPPSKVDDLTTYIKGFQNKTKTN